MPLSVTEFVKRWKINSLSERSGSQSHFIDLCDMLGQPHPAAADAAGERYAFDKPLNKVYGGKGFADVWLRDHFAWEYKGKHKDLKAAYKQINDYREDLGNPPLLVVCDLDRFEIHTNFTATTKRIYAFNLSELELNQVTANCPLPPLEVLRNLFGDTNLLRPDRTDAYVTQEAAKLFAKLAERLEIEKRAHTDSPQASKEQIAHFLMRVLFCLFADSVDLLPDRVFRRLIEIDRFYPRRFLLKLPHLFAAMSSPDGIFGEHTIRYFNGGLFDPRDISTIQLDKQDMAILYDVAHKYNWAHVAPAIFGTLFERSLDEARRSLIGAHYTSAEDILLLIEPVLMRPLEQRWSTVQSNILTILHPGEEPGAPSSPTVSSSAKVGSQDANGQANIPTALSANGHANILTALSANGQANIPTALSANGAATSQPGAQPQETSSQENQGLKARPKISAKPLSLLSSNLEAERLLAAWIDELTNIRVLDPACGSGNFLYLALRRMLDLWLEAQRFAAANDISMVLPKMVSPTQLFGIETEFYAHELASIVVWIGFLQWKHDHGITEDAEPILKKLTNIEHADAILRYDAEGNPYEPTWPPANFIIGNPPFLGGKLLRRELGDTYIDDLFALYKGRVKAESDLVVYWFEKARAQLQAGLVDRVGLLATQAIRGGANRAVLERIQETGTIFWAWSDRKWLLTGAAVRVSMIAFERTPINPVISTERTPTDTVISTGGASSAPQWRDPCIPPSAPTNPVILSGARSAQSKDPEAAHPTHTLNPLSTTTPSAGGAPYTSVGRSPTSTASQNPQAPEAALYQRRAQPYVHRQPEFPRAGGPPYTSVGRSPTSTASQNPQGPEARSIQFLLDGQSVPFINPDLTTGSNSASALRLKENEGLCFMGTTKVGAFDIDYATAQKMLTAPLNPNGRPNSDVVRPWVNALDITRRPRNMFIIDFGTDMTEQDAALYELPFEYLIHHVKLSRAQPNRDLHDKPWWLHGRARGDLRQAIKPLTRYILTSRVSKHRLFIWQKVTTIPDSATFAIAREDDYFFGVLHSSIHELWARAQGTQLREVESGFRYTPNSTFDTFPFPYPPGTEPTEADSPLVRAIADAARELVRLRDAWLNPPGSEADLAILKDRTLTKLYNARPEWLANAHRTLDAAVFAAYNWPLEFNGQDLTDQDLLARLLALNHQRAAIQN